MNDTAPSSVSGNQIIGVNVLCVLDSAGADMSDSRVVFLDWSDRRHSLRFPCHEGMSHCLPPNFVPKYTCSFVCRVLHFSLSDLSEL